MELRRRKDRVHGATAGDSSEAADRISAEGIDGDQHRQQGHQVNEDNRGRGDVVAQPSSEAAADAVVGAAVRGGSLLMLLALVQVSCMSDAGNTCNG